MHIIFQFSLFLWIVSVTYSVFTEWILGIDYRAKIKKIKKIAGRDK